MSTWQWLRKRCLKLPFQHGLESQLKIQKYADSKGNISLWRAANPSKTVNSITGQKKLPLRKSQEKQEHATAHHCYSSKIWQKELFSWGVKDLASVPYLTSSPSTEQNHYNFSKFPDIKTCTGPVKKYFCFCSLFGRSYIPSYHTYPGIPTSCSNTKPPKTKSCTKSMQSAACETKQLSSR